MNEDFFEIYDSIAKMDNLEEKITRLKKNKNKVRVCKFCLKNEQEVTFKEDAHMISESIGNKKLFSNNECDKCNREFGSTYEDSFGKYVLPFRFISQIYGKKNINKYKDKHQRIEMKKNVSPLPEVSESLNAFILEDNTNQSVKFTENGFIITYKRQKYNPFYVYKALQKMAFSVMEIKDLINCNNSFAGLIVAINKDIPDEEKYNILTKSPNLGCLEFVPGINPFNGVGFELYRRKEVKMTKRYSKYIFKIYFGNFSLQIPIAADTDLDGNAIEFKPNISFQNSTLTQLDFTQIEHTYSCEFSGEKYELDEKDKEKLEDILIKRELLNKNTE